MVDLEQERRDFYYAERSGTWHGSFNATLTLSYVGMEYMLNGEAKLGYGVSSPNKTALLENKLSDGVPDRFEWKHTNVGVGSNLGSMAGLEPGSHVVQMISGKESSVTFSNATVRVPIRTQGPDFEQLKAQSTFFNAVQGSEANSSLNISTCSVVLDLGKMYRYSNLTAPTFANSDVEPKHSVVDGHLLLAVNAEASYKVPPNTSLVEVLGPVGTNQAWTGRGQCYVTLDPRPWWWKGSRIPYSTSFKKALQYNMSNQTMFLLPLSPSEEYTISVGNLGEGTTCALNGIRSYPFHFDYDFKAPVQASTDGSSSGYEQAAKPAKVNPTRIIVGVVVGVVGGLAVLAVLLWLWRWRRRKRALQEAALLPDSFTPGPGTGAEDLPKGSTPEPATGAHMTESNLPQTPEPRLGATVPNEYVPPRRFLQEEDAEDVLEILPPRYRQRDYLEAGPSLPSTPGDTPGLPASGSSSSRQMESALLANERADSESPGPPLKEAYKRVFESPPRTVPSGPRPLGDFKRLPSAGLQGSAPTTGDEHPGSLRMEYKRAFGSDSAQSQSTKDPASVPESHTDRKWSE